jgi:hypothetical protein
MTALNALNTPRRNQVKKYEIPIIKKKETPIQWIGKQVARLKEKKKISLRKEKARNHKVTLNALIVISRDIMPGITTRNRNRMEKLEQKLKP